MTNLTDVLETPFFIVASERSGTTLLYLMLDHHPELSLAQEMEYLSECIPDQGPMPTSDQMQAVLEADHIFRGAQFSIAKGLSAEELGRSFLNQVLTRSNKRIVGATVHKAFHRFDRLWPNARYIHMVRDGRDVSRSCIQMGWDGNVFTGCDRWIEAEKLWEDFQKIIPDERRCEISYESLIEQPEKELARLCNFIGVDYDKKMLNYPEDSTYSTPDPKLTQQWKRKLSDVELGLVEGRIGDMLIERNYVLSGKPIRKVGKLGQVFFRINSKIARVMFRFKRYGSYLILVSFFTRRLGLESVNEKIQLRIDDITDQHNK